ncbi:SDR family oxidoreductase [Bacillus sp. FJAT-50079]|uniref:SDR family NAD(P)-dependent oxidoreductase n=1 Tax=Bacillus sp. FJAT-50079 TaxID=2833577 RepID=UPI001BC99369|nr:SDR family oxidoreductase [Bacillus sp. FJAT-50079]MBS4209679.1 SDR family oxidoreductase [Bacillus sp. FJAT-50079]
MRNERIKGKTIVITGASGGLGEKIAYTCAQSGANLVLLARNQEKLTQIAERIRMEYQVDCTAMELDVSRHDMIPGAFQQIVEHIGSIDILVNNAGYGTFIEARHVELADVQGMFAVNVLGLIACTREVLPTMIERHHGHIINIASQAGKLATPKSSVYAATKHAVLGFTNSLRMEMSQHGIYVTAVNPGPIRTNFFELADPNGTYIENVDRLMLDPDKVAEKIVAAMLTNRREINLPGWMNMTSILHTLMPRIVERLGRKAFFKK